MCRHLFDGTSRARKPNLNALKHPLKGDQSDDYFQNDRVTVEGHPAY
jgi:hypothetical protein